jgi:(p)ppGpp synthase/HD superfamily hydrolase
MMTPLAKAIECAIHAHAEYTDDDGMFHFIHCIAVMLATKQATEYSGVLNYEILRNKGFNLIDGNNESDTEEAAKQLLNELMIAAVLHDVVEDTPITLDYVESLFGKNVRNLVDGVTRRSIKKDGIEESYRDFIYRAKQTPGSRLIKVADLTHNYERSSHIKKASRRDKLLFKYSIALRVLNDADQPTWEQASAFAEYNGTEGHYLIADPDGDKIEITEAEFESLTKNMYRPQISTTDKI